MYAHGFIQYQNLTKSPVENQEETIKDLDAKLSAALSLVLPGNILSMSALSYLRIVAIRQGLYEVGRDLKWKNWEN